MKLATGFFPSTGVAHIYLAAQAGLFAAAGLDVELHAVTSAHQQMELWDTGVLTVMHTSPDHLFGDRARSPVALRAEAFGELCLYGRPGLVLGAETRYGLDRPDSGFALVLRRMLERRGVPWSEDALISVGGTGQRWAALAAGKIDATLLHTPFRQQAEQQGFVRLAGHFAVLPALTTAVVVAGRDDVGTPPVLAYLRALREARSRLVAAGAPLLTDVLVRAGLDKELVRLVVEDTAAELGAGRGTDLLTGVTEAAELRRRYGVLNSGRSVTDVVASTRRLR